MNTLSALPLWMPLLMLGAVSAGTLSNLLVRLHRRGELVSWSLPDPHAVCLRMSFTQGLACKAGEVRDQARRLS